METCAPTVADFTIPTVSMRGLSPDQKAALDMAKYAYETGSEEMAEAIAEGAEIWDEFKLWREGHA